ncbi:MAG TPA: SGNH/GDSL hydrolase family protein [Pseudomonadales bacterium]
MRRFFYGLCITVVSLVLLYGVGEAVIRGLQSAGWVPVFSSKSLSRNQTPNQHLNARMKRSENPALFIEFDRDDPNINSQGFRGDDFPLAKSPGTTRIAIIGDSVAYGYGVALADSFPRRLEGLLQANGFPVEVLNFAISGHGSVAEAELLHQRVWEYQPDIVLLAYVLNDPVPPQLMMENIGAAMRATARLDRVARKSQLGAWLLLLWMDASRVMLGGMDRYRSFYESDEYWQPVVQSIEAMQAEALAHDVPLLAAIFPLFRDFNNYPLTYCHEQAGQLFEATGIPYVDLLGVYRQSDYRRFMLVESDDTHPNPAGHEVAAESLAVFLQPWLESHPAQ